MSFTRNVIYVLFSHIAPCIATSYLSNQVTVTRVRMWVEIITLLEHDVTTGSVLIVLSAVIGIC